jgi:hypothetical protein
MIRLTTQSMTNAIARAKTVRPKVRVINADNRTYAVYGSRGDAYTVRFAVINGHKLGECNCPEFGNLIWVHPSFWCKSDFLLFIMDEYQVTFCRS